MGDIAQHRIGLIPISDFLLLQFGEQGMVQWWECLSPINVGGIQIPASTPYVG